MQFCHPVSTRLKSRLLDVLVTCFRAFGGPWKSHYDSSQRSYIGPIIADKSKQLSIALLTVTVSHILEFQHMPAPHNNPLYKFPSLRFAPRPEALCISCSAFRLALHRFLDVIWYGTQTPPWNNELPVLFNGDLG